MSDWEELELSANRMQERYERSRRHMYYSEREQVEREIRQMREIADRERDKYVRWLWGR